MKPGFWLSLILLLFNYSDVFAQTRQRFVPATSAGVAVFYPHVLDGNTYNCYGATAAHNLNLLKGRSRSLSFEPCLGLGWANPSAAGRKPALLTDLSGSMMFRQKLGPVVFGLGYYAGLTSIRNDYTYSGYIGGSFRLGYVLHSGYSLESVFSGAVGGEEGVGHVGLRFVWLR